jgi:CBS domain-containing protein
MKARDVMTKDVVTVRASATVREIAEIMTAKRISGVPVVTENGAVIGIVSESDLLHRTELGTEPKYKWWLRVFSDPDQMARDYTKTHGLKAADLMSRYVVSVSPEDELADVAQVLDRNKIKRVPVLHDGTLAGLITRGDLVKALTQTKPEARLGPIDSGALQRRINQRMKDQSWLDASMINVIVGAGAVQLWGYVNSWDQKRALMVLVEETEGVTAVDDHLNVGLPAISAV